MVEIYNSIHKGSVIDAQTTIDKIRSDGDLIPIITFDNLPDIISNLITLVPGKLYEPQATVVLPDGVQVQCSGSGFVGAGPRFPNFGIKGKFAGPLLVSGTDDVHLDDMLVENTDAAGSCFDFSGGTVVIRSGQYRALASIGLYSGGFFIVDGPSCINAA